MPTLRPGELTATAYTPLQADSSATLSQPDRVVVYYAPKHNPILQRRFKLTP